MVEKYLSGEEIARIFKMGADARMRDFDEAGELKKTAGVVGDILDRVTGAASKVPSAYLGLLGLSATAGLGLGAGYHVLSRGMQADDEPDMDMKKDTMKLYGRKVQELKDRNWMKRVRAMRDELKRDGRKMGDEEYAVKYKALSNALEERRGGPGGLGGGL